MNEKDFIKIDEILAKMKKEDNKENNKEEMKISDLVMPFLYDSSNNWVLLILFFALFSNQKQEPTINIYVGSEE